MEFFLYQPYYSLSISVDNFSIAESCDPQKQFFSKKTRISNSEIFAENSFFESNPNFPLWKVVILSLPSSCLLNEPILNISRFEQFANVKISFPDLTCPVEFKIGSVEFPAVFPSMDVKLPLPWNTNLDDLAKSIQKLAHQIVKSVFKLMDVHQCIANGVPYGAFSVNKPKDGGGIFNASKDTLLEFNNTVDQAARSFVSAVNTAALRATEQTIASYRTTLEMLYRSMVEKRKEEIMQLLSTVDRRSIQMTAVQRLQP